MTNRPSPGDFVPDEEDELRLPPELKGRLTKLILHLQKQQSNQLHGSNGTADNGDNNNQQQRQQQVLIQKLQQHIEQLETKCSALEAQAILVSVQQLDLLAQGMAWTCSLAVLGLYLYGTSLFTSGLYHCFSDQSTNDEALPVVGAIAATIIESEASTTSWVLQTTWFLAIQIILRGALWAWPYWYNQITHGSVHRRFEVFAVAFLVIARVRLCRWRERIFITNDDNDEGKQMEAVPGDEETDAEQSNNHHSATYGRGITEEALWDANYEVSARFLYVSIIRLRGLWTKTAQYLSSRADFMPPSYVRELKRLQDEAPASAWDDIKGVVPPHILDALTRVDEKPLASASIGQVHVGYLKKTGQKVCLKVQHPHARSLIMDDLWSLSVILKVVAWMEPDYEFLNVLMTEWAKGVTDELDFGKETQNLRDAQTALATLTCGDAVLYTSEQSIPFQVEVPRPIDNLCNDRVLVMSFCEGVRIDQFDQLRAWNLSRCAIVDGVSQAFAHFMYTSSIFQSDPHIGNLLVRPGTTQNKEQGFTVVVLDWGLAKRLQETKRLAFCELVLAAATFDYGLLLDSYRHIGLEMKRENAALSMQNVRFFLRDMAPAAKARKRIKAKLKFDEKYTKALPKNERVPMKSKAYPGDFLFFVRVNELLHGLGSKLQVDLQFMDLIRPYAERGLRESELYNKSNHTGLQSTRDRIPPSVRAPGTDQELENKLLGLFSDLRLEGNFAGGQMYAIDKSGRTLANVVAGHQGGLKSHVPMELDTLVLGFSCTKAVAATMAHIMVKEKYLAYDDPICSIWTAFAPTESTPEALKEAMVLKPNDDCDDNDDESNVKKMSLDELNQRWRWKRQITLWHVLTHQAGMWSALPAQMTMKSFASCEACCAAFEYNDQKPDETLLPLYAPGQKSEYHYLSFGWLVAGTLCQAYAKRHKLDHVTFEAVYRAILHPRLSVATKASGFQPCGGSGGHALAKTCTTDIQASKLLQRRRESLAIGEGDDQAGKEQAETLEKLKQFRGKEFLLDPRGWNSLDGVEANTPAAGGRFSAAGLAHFYHDLGSGRLVEAEVVRDVTEVLVQDMGLSALQGATSTVAAHGTKGASSSDDDGQNNNDDDAENRTMLGCGYQLIRFNQDDVGRPSAFGHAGVGGSIGFYHKPTGMAVGLMLNKADGQSKEITMRIMKEFSEHYGI